MLLSAEKAAAVIENGDGSCHVDPVLSRDAKAYHQFASDLHDCHLVGFTDRQKIQVGCFKVTKKGDKQRLTLDARPANRLFPNTAFYPAWFD